MSRKTLSAIDLEKSFKGKTVVKGLSLNVQSAEIVGLLGPNGAGKTTTFYMMAGIFKPDRGKVLVDTLDITSMNLSQRARAGLSYLPQERSVFQGLSVEQNLLGVLEFQDISRQERLERKDRLLEEFNLQHVSRNRARSLSGGEARRLEIARALAIEPDFLLMDEPFAGIDPITVTTIQDIIIGLKARGMAILISDHNVRETMRICDRAFILSKGGILASGTPDEIAANPEVRTVYLGEGFSL